MRRRCPECAASIAGVLATEEVLDNLGYKHRDETIVCPECDARITFGVPLEGETDDPPACPVCGGRTYPYKLDFHEPASHLDRLRVEDESPGSGVVQAIARDLDVHWKCETCWYRHNGDLEHLTADVYSLGVRHLEGARDHD